MKFRKICSVLSALLITISVLSGCGSSNNTGVKYNKNPEINILDSKTIAENDKLKLDYIDNLKGITVTDKITGKVWSNLETDEAGNFVVSSTLNINVQDMEIYKSEGNSSDALIEQNKINVKEIKNGLEFTYYFDEYGISIPVSYTLANDSLKISIDGAKIAESKDKYRLVSATPSSRFCRVKDGSDENYIFLPLGNGAISIANDSPDGEKSYDIGPDNYVAINPFSNVNLPSTARMPVYGVKDGNSAVFCIAEETPGSVGIISSAGSGDSEYSSVKPDIFFVDYDYTYGKAVNSREVRHLSERTQDVITIGCYFLQNEKANYVGMAECYRNYLQKNGFLKTSEFKNSPYSVNILGGVLSTTSILGIPVKTVKTLTTINRAKDMIDELSKLTSYNPTVCLSGFGGSGINAGKIAGGFKINSKLGDKKDIASIEKYAAKNGISLFTDFEMTKFSKSGNGFSYKKDSAKTAMLHTSDKSGYTVPLREASANDTYRVLSRGKQGKVVEKLIKKTDKLGISAVNFSTLGSVTYSDYNKKDLYSLSSRTESDVKKYINEFNKNGKKVSGKASAYFASGLMDTVFDVDVIGDGHYSFDYHIPFYQMVFSDVTPLYTTALNISSNPEELMSYAASSGVGINFTLIDQFDISYMETNKEKLYACDFEGNKDRIKSYVAKFAEVYGATSGSRIVNYEIADNGVTVTTFENGSVVYANHSSESVDSAIGILKGYEFKLGGKK